MRCKRRNFFSVIYSDKSAVFFTRYSTPVKFVREAFFIAQVVPSAANGGLRVHSERSGLRKGVVCKATYGSGASDEECDPEMTHVGGVQKFAGSW